MTLFVVTPMFFAFLAPLLGALGLGVVGQAIVGLGLSLGLGYLARKLQPQPDTAVRGMSLSLQTDSNDDRQVAFGRCASAGSLKYHNTYGPNGNDYLQLVFQLADHECDALEAVIVNGERKAILSDASTAQAGGNGVEDYVGVMWVAFYSGAWGQSADADLVAEAPIGGWDSNNRGRGVCYVRVTLKADAKKFKTGLPEFVWVFRGAKLYDPRQDTSVGGDGVHRWSDEATREWSDNLALCAYNYLRGIHVNGALLAGVSAPAASLPVADWIDEANACDEDVGLKAGGTEPRYRMGGIVDCGTEPRSVLREMLAACGGDLIDSGGIFKLRVGVARSSVMTLTDDDIEMQGEVEIVPKLSRSQLVNTVYGSFTDPAQGYASTSLPPRIAPSDQAADGGIELAEHYNLAFVTSGPQGQRVLEILRRRGRYQRRISLPLRARFAVLEAGDWVTFNSDRYGISGGLFEVLQSQLGRHLYAQCELAETAASVYAFTPSSDELDPGAPKIVSSGGSTFTTVQDFALANVTVSGGAAEVTRPGLRATWAPIDDATVVQIRIEYRRVGDTVALERVVLDPAAGEYTWVDGVQGATQYEARALPVTRPERATSWTGWTATGASSGGQAVAVAVMVTEVESVPPDTITTEMLSAQTRLELALVTATDAIQGSVSERITELRTDLERVSASLLGTISYQDKIMRAVRKTVDGNTTSVVELLEVTDGLAGSWTIAVDVNDNIVAAVRLDGSETTSGFTVLAENFAVAAPAHPTITPFVVSPDGIFIDGVTVKEGTLSAGALIAETLYTLLIQDPDNTYYFDFAEGKLGTTDGDYLIDLKNKTFEIRFG